MYQRNRQGWLKHIDFILIDAIVLQLSFIIAYIIRHGWSNPYGSETYRTFALLLFITDVLVSIAFNTFHNVLKRGYYKEFVETLKQTLLVFLIMTLYMFSVQGGTAYSRTTIFLTAGFHLVLGYLATLTWKHILKHSGTGKMARTMILVSDEGHVAEVLGNLSDQDHFKYSGVILTNRDAAGETVGGLKVVANFRNAADYICREWVDEVFIYPGEAALFTDISDPAMGTAETDGGMLNNLISQCREMAVPVHIRMPITAFGGKSFVEKIGGYAVLTSTANYASPLQLAIKRLMDIVFGFFGSIIALILMAVIGPFIKHESPGPILFKQQRIGRNGKRFTCFKIRSMYMDAEERKKEFLSQNRVSDGMMFKLDFDPRIIGNKIVDGKQVTGIGEFIRKHSLDEFPQFFNVLAGQMSLVGTRPPTVDEWEKYKYHHRARLAFKPGITGLWQVSGRSNITDFEEVVKLDTEYIQHWSLGLDIKILLKTIGVLFNKEGAL